MCFNALREDLFLRLVLQEKGFHLGGLVKEYIFVYYPSQRISRFTYLFWEVEIITFQDFLSFFFFTLVCILENTLSERDTNLMKK